MPSLPYRLPGFSGDFPKTAGIYPRLPAFGQSSSMFVCDSISVTVEKHINTEVEINNRGRKPTTNKQIKNMN